MIRFDNENYVKNLPDCYNKKDDSNNFKLLENDHFLVSKLKQDGQAVLDTLDLDNSYGKTLDLYGEMVGQPRGIMTDSQYRLMIKAKIMRFLSTGNYDSVITALCMTFNCSPTEIILQEVENRPCVVMLSGLPLEVINRAGMTIPQAMTLVKAVLPAGVRLEQYSFEGTFRFADNDWEETTTNGFASDDGTIQGGYLGTIGHYKNN